METIKDHIIPLSPLGHLMLCENEPIRILGKIQSHGFLIAVKREVGNIVYISESISRFLDIDPVQLLNKTIENFELVTKMDSGYFNARRFIGMDETQQGLVANPLKISFDKKYFNLIINPSNEFILFEFEPADELRDSDSFYQLIGAGLSKILEGVSLHKVLENAASQVKVIIAYSRVMIYKFHEDGHGEVIAEAKDENLETFFGLHYPASDIPVQARELYKLNQVRIIANVEDVPTALLVTDPKYVKSPLDLTHSTLRAVSPVHIEYLKNMGVGASFSVSIIIKDKLWGLIACHNRIPAFICYEERNSPLLIGKILASSIQYREDKENKEQQLGFASKLRSIITRAGNDGNIESNFISNNNLLGLTNATGAVLSFENKLSFIGFTPSERQVKDLITWISSNDFPPVYQVEKLSDVYGPASFYQEYASGILVAAISKPLNEYIIWFKPEIIKTIKWAGNPAKPMQVDGNGNTTLSPRLSFKAWTETVEGTSEGWSAGEVFSATNTRDEIRYLLNQKANQVRELHEALQKAYTELDTFSYTISHDLSDPLATIKTYVQLLIEDYPEVPAGVKNILKKVVRNADQMTLLIKGVLSYSRLERDGLELIEVNVKSLLERIKEDLLIRHDNTWIEINLSSNPVIVADAVMLYQVFANLIGNAVKYSAQSVSPKVIVTEKDEADEKIYSIQDNGVGIDSKYGNQVFDLFKRLGNTTDFNGTGVGLAIVKRIVEKHHGKIWYESKLGKGTTFFVSFRKKI